MSLEMKRRDFLKSCAVAIGLFVVDPIKAFASIANIGKPKFNPDDCYGNYVTLSDWVEPELTLGKNVLVKNIRKTFKCFGFDGIPRNYAKHIKIIYKPPLKTKWFYYRGTIGWIYNPHNGEEIKSSNSIEIPLLECI